MFTTVPSEADAYRRRQIGGPVNEKKSHDSSKFIATANARPMFTLVRNRFELDHLPLIQTTEASALHAEICTKTSLPPPWGWMKP